MDKQVAADRMRQFVRKRLKNVEVEGSLVQVVRFGENELDNFNCGFKIHIL